MARIKKPFVIKKTKARLAEELKEAQSKLPKIKPEKPKPKPFIKWNNDADLSVILQSKLPKTYNKYHEPFIGRGDLFFKELPKNASISDNNQELINSYNIIKNNPDELINDLFKHTTCEDWFYYIRDIKLKTLNNIERASRFIFLNENAINKKYIEGFKGRCLSRYAKQRNSYNYNLIVDNIKTINSSFKLIKPIFFCSDYKNILNNVCHSDLVYLNAKHHIENQIELYTTFIDLTILGAFVIMVIENELVIQELYKDYNIHIVDDFNLIVTNY